MRKRKRKKDEGLRKEILFSGLVVLETTNEIVNQQLYDYVNTSQLLSWMRVMLANRLYLDILITFTSLSYIIGCLF
jgi:FtsH-binding integral membrane protein